MKRLTATALFALSISAATAGELPQLPPVRDEISRRDAFIDELMSRMTRQEKLGQMNLLSVGSDVTGPVVSGGVEEKIASGEVGGVFNTTGASNVRKLQDIVMQKSRLKIPMLFGYDVIHGYRTIFPIPLGLASSFEPLLVERTAQAAAAEATADGIHWTFSPMVDISRDPRWGRICEGSGEDPYLGSLIARAMVRGYQGTRGSNETLPVDRMLACVKHFALYGAAEAGRDYNTVDMSAVRMYNEYLPPYRAAINAGAATVMTSFNDINGVPATANKWLVTDLLRRQWGFRGMVVTDYTAVSEMIAHGTGDAATVTAGAINAGIDMDMVSELFTRRGGELVDSGRVDIKLIDNAVRRVLQAKYRLGLFQDPYRYCDVARESEKESAGKKALALEAATKSMVLLKNDGVLPLAPGKKIAFIGPMVKDRHNLIGSWSAQGDREKSISLWQALVEDYGGEIEAGRVAYARGCDIVDDRDIVETLNRDGGKLEITRPRKELIEEATTLAAQSDIVVACLGEPFGMTGEAASRADIRLPQCQLELLSSLKNCGKPVVLVLYNGRPLDLSAPDSMSSAVLETWYGGTASGTAVVDILFGQSVPQGRLPVSFPRHVGQVPVYYAHKNTGRPYVPKEKFHSQYLDVDNTPLYPFGHGLTYTDFTYGPLGLDKISIDKTSINKKDTVSARVTVTNTGKRAATETVQLYIRDIAGSITRPVRELRGLRQVSLAPGESAEVSFAIDGEMLSFYDESLHWVLEPGDFEVFIGHDSTCGGGMRFSVTP